MKGFINKLRSVSALRAGVYGFALALAVLVGGGNAFAVDPVVDYAGSFGSARTELLTLFAVIVPLVFGIYILARTPRIALKMLGKAAN